MEASTGRSGAGDKGGSSNGRASALHADDEGSTPSPPTVVVAELETSVVQRRTVNPETTGSSPVDHPRKGVTMESYYPGRHTHY